MKMGNMNVFGLVYVLYLLFLDALIRIASTNDSLI